MNGFRKARKCTIKCKFSFDFIQFVTLWLRTHVNEGTDSRIWSIFLLGLWCWIGRFQHLGHLPFNNLLGRKLLMVNSLSLILESLRCIYKVDPLKLTHWIICIDWWLSLVIWITRWSFVYCLFEKILISLSTPSHILP